MCLGVCSYCSLTFLSPRNFGLVIPVPVTELHELKRLKLLRIASKQFAPLLLPPGFASLAATLSELVLESADWPAIPQVSFEACAIPTPPRLAHMHSSGLKCQLHGRDMQPPDRSYACVGAMSFQSVQELAITPGAPSPQKRLPAEEVTADMRCHADMAAAHAPEEATGAQAVFQLTKLRLLAVRASGLRKLTAEVAVLKALRRLDVSRSRDLEVQEDIPWSSMASLKSLDLSECRHLRVCAAFQRHTRVSPVGSRPETQHAS